jgi:hypothetical protein
MSSGSSDYSYNTVYANIEELFNELFPITNEYFSQIPEEGPRTTLRETIKGLFLEKIKPYKELSGSKSTYYFNDGFDFTITNGSFLYNSSNRSLDIDSDLSIKLTSKKDPSQVIDITIDKESFKNPEERLTEGSDGVKRYTYNLTAEAVKDFGIIKLDNFSVTISQKPDATSVTNADVGTILKKNNDARNENEKERIKKVGLEVIKEFLESGKFTDAPPETIKLIADTVSDSLDKTELEIKEQLSTSDELAAGLSIFSAISNGLKHHFNNPVEKNEIIAEGNDGKYTPGPNNDSTNYVAWLNTQPNISKDQYNALKDRWNFLISQPNPDGNNELRNIEQLNKTLRGKKQDVVELKNGPQYIEWTQAQDLKNGGKRKTEKRGGKNTRRRAKRSNRRRSGRRGKRTSRR